MKTNNIVHIYDTPRANVCVGVFHAANQLSFVRGTHAQHGNMGGAISSFHPTISLQARAMFFSGSNAALPCCSLWQCWR